MSEPEFDLEHLTPEEKRRLQSLLSLNQKTISRLQKVAEEDERMEWLWALARRAASTVAIILGAVFLLFDSIKAAVRGFFP